MKFLIFLLKLCLFVLMSYIASIPLNESYKKKHEKNLEKGDKPDYTFIMAEFDKDKYEFKTIHFEGDKLYEKVKEYLEKNGNKKLFLPHDGVFQNNFHYETYSVIEKTKEYELVEIYSELDDWDLTFRYKVFYNGNVIPTYSFDNYYLSKMGTYMLVPITGLILTKIIVFLLKIAVNRFKRRKKATDVIITDENKE